MTLPHTAHTSRPWRIHGLTRDFQLEDVWQLPTCGDVGDFRRVVKAVAALDPARTSSLTLRTLFVLRRTIGGMLALDAAHAGLDSRVPALRNRLPRELREAPGPKFAHLPFTSLYLLDDEFAAESANATMHGVIHLGWVNDGRGAFGCQMAVLVKRNGLLGTGYMAAIKPFRYLLVYPLLMRAIEREWRPAERAEFADSGFPT